MSLNTPFWFQQFRYANGAPLVGGNLYTYYTETTTPKAIFYDDARLIPCPNPLPLDDSGFLPQYYLGSGYYTFILKDKDGNTIAQRDNIEGAGGYNHNELGGLQGGTSGEYYHLTLNQYNMATSGYLPLSGGTLTGNLSGTNIVISGTNTANSFVKSGGTSAQFLKADGSVDENNYALGSSLSGFLPLSGGTLTGELSGTIISAQSFVVSGGTSAQFLKGDGTLDSNAYMQLTDMVGEPTYYAIYSSAVSANSNNHSISWRKDAGATYINGRVESGLLISGVPVAYVNSSGLRVEGILQYTGGYFRDYTDPTYTSFYAGQAVPVINTYSLLFDKLRRYSYINGISRSGLNVNGAQIVIASSSGCSVNGMVSATGNVYGNSFVKSGGTSAQFLKADGSVDENVYGGSVSGYLPLSAGSSNALSGTLYGQTLNFTTTTNAPIQITQNTSGGFSHPLRAFNSGMTSGSQYNIDFGRAESNYNAGNFGFKYFGAGSHSNWITFGLFGANDLLTINGDGLVNIKNIGTGIVRSTSGNLYTGSLSASEIPTLSYLPLAGGTMNDDAAVVFNATSANWEPSAIIINRPHVTGSQTKDAGIDISTGNGHGLRIANIAGNFYSGMVVNNASSEFGAELLVTGSATKSLYANGYILVDNFIQANSFVKAGGTDTQFLKANGSVDSNSYALGSSLGNYLPLSGGEMNNETSIVFPATGDVRFTAYGVGGMFNGNGDNASYSSYNLKIKSWWGIGFEGYDNVTRTVLDTRTGNFSTLGGVYGNTGEFAQITATSLIEPTPYTPASASASGTTGTIVWDSNYVYVCVATNTWKRAAISTW